MNTHIHIAFLFFYMGFLGCKDAATNPTTPAADDILKSQLIGTWEAPWYSIQYKSDGTFIDTSTKWVVSEPSNLWVTIRNGDYSVRDGLLQWANVNHIFTSTLGNWRGYSANYPTSFDILIQGDSLALHPIDCLTLVEGSPGQLWGTWSITRWVVHQFGDTTIPTYQGRERRQYTFISDSSFLFVQAEYLDSQPLPVRVFSSKIHYSDAHIYLGTLGDDDTLTVSFSGSQMTWRKNSSSGQLKRKV